MKFKHKITGECKTIDIPEYTDELLKEKIFAMHYLTYSDFVQIPEYDIEELRQKGLLYYKNKANEFRNNKIVLEVNKVDNSIFLAEADLSLETLNDWIIVKNKIGNVKKVNLVNSETKLNEIIELTDEEILRLNEIITQMVDNITELDVKISNKIKTASDELILSVFNMNEQQLELFTNTLIQNSENILNMSDEEFDNYVLSLLS